ncbi:MAG: hypothetical protein HOK95_02900, partial [Candidatus Marinimicrobia bacterium]|nr:hypothetical protein [Candidatus Neomarinimicrobiota bacterium]
LSVQKDDTIIAAKKAAELIGNDPDKQPYKEKDNEEGTSGGISEKDDDSVPEGPTKKGVKSLDFTATIPWTQLSQLISGVFNPLRQGGDTEMEIKMNVKATSESGFDRTTLDSRVKETLQQIGASIDNWQED